VHSPLRRTKVAAQTQSLEFVEASLAVTS